MTGEGEVATGGEVRRRPTMRDVAELAGVSLKTVSRVVNDEPSVSEAVVARVRSAIETLNYQPDERAGNLRRSAGRTGTLGLVVSSVANPFAGAVHRAIEDAASERGVLVVASSLDDDPDREEQIVSNLLRRRVDGLILTAVGTTQRYLAPEQAYGTPMVFVDREPVDLLADSVTSDNIAGAAVATRHLLQHGHQRIAFLGDRADIQSARERHGSFCTEILAAGLDPDGLPQIDGLHTEDAATQAALAIMGAHDAPTAIFSSQNLITIGVVRALRELGIERRIAVVGFDDFPLADMLDPGVTVIAQDPDRIGQLAAERYFARLEGDDSPARRYVLPTRLIVRGSGELPRSGG